LKFKAGCTNSKQIVCRSLRSAKMALLPGFTPCAMHAPAARPAPVSLVPQSASFSARLKEFSRAPRFPQQSLACGIVASGMALRAACAVRRRRQAEVRTRTVAWARKFQSRQVTTADPVIIDLQDIPLTVELGSWYEGMLDAAVESLEAGGLGLIPTDTQYAFVTSVSSGGGPIYQVKGLPPETKKPLSLLCADLSMASRFADIGMLDRRSFQGMRRSLPGCYTFILRATSEVPRVVLQHKSRRKLWQRKEVGIRIPDNSVVRYLASKLGEPLLASSACGEPSQLWTSQMHLLDFIVQAPDDHGGDVDEAVSTIIDLTREEPWLVREGLGDPAPFFG